MENQRQVVTADQIRTWCANPDTQVTGKPVIDLNEHIHIEGYEVPDRLREQTILATTPRFPGCTRSARKADADHVIPYAEGGTTSSDNIAPLCRRHHRLKTHSAWGYTMLEPGTYLWSSPHGYQCIRDHHGTLDVSRDRHRPRRIHRATSFTAPHPAGSQPPAGPQACWHLIDTGLVCPLAARPPVLADAGVWMWLRDARWRSLLNHRRGHETVRVEKV